MIADAKGKEASVGRVDQWDRFAMTAAVDSKIHEIGGNDGMFGMKFTQTDQAKVGEVWLTIGETVG